MQGENTWQLNPAVGFVVRAAFWVVLLFGTLRLEWVQQNLMIPFAGLQHQVACSIAGTPKDAVVVNQSCTGSDAMALCVGAILAFPAPWRRRLAGCALGLLLISAVNTVRIGTLSMVVDNRELFKLLHLYLWPGFIIVVAAAYVFFWMASADRQSGSRTEVREGPIAAMSPAATRFLLLTVVFVGLYYFAYSRLLESAALMTVARWAASAAGFFMSALGQGAQVADNYLRTPHGAWVVTPECVATPLIPIYLAAVFTAHLSPLKRLLALLATPPLFILLGTARLLVLALPLSLVRSHNVAVHAFYQFLLALLLVVLLFYRQHRSNEPSFSRLLSRISLALLLGGGVGLLVGALDGGWLRPALAALTEGIHLGHGYTDPQGALRLLPAFQLGLFAALWKITAKKTPWPKLTVAVLLLLLSQAVVVVGIGELATHSAVPIPVVLVRALSLALPAVLVWLLVRRESREIAERRAVPLASSG
jgi:exosortase/archaeosortase family protein